MSSRRGNKRRRTQAFQDVSQAVAVESAEAEQETRFTMDEQELPADQNMDEEDAATSSLVEKKREIWDAFKEENYELLEQLPLSIHRSYSLMLELDQQADSQHKQLLCDLQNYCKKRMSLARRGIPSVIAPAVQRNSEADVAESAHHDSPASIPTSEISKEGKLSSTRKYLTSIACLSEGTVRASNEKVNVAKFTCDLVDRYIRELDRSIKDLETSITLGLRPGTHPAAIMLPPVIVPGRVTRPAQSPGAEDEDQEMNIEPPNEEQPESLVDVTVGTEEAEEELPNPPPTVHKRRPQKRRWTRAPKPKIQEAVPSGETEQAAGNEENVAPRKLTLTLRPPAEPQPEETEEPQAGANEEVYCYCRNVSHGSMVACDAEDAGCEIVWFHLDCLGLQSEPDTRFWFCNDCLKNGRADKALKMKAASGELVEELDIGEKRQRKAGTKRKRRRG
ncbi:hypothetical protein C8Q75DRAFT_802006 [Abortiporus biennis]|nr:hypothetical protein C8Q75DRAFT_802006 [Abortiporus biennis]